MVKGSRRPFLNILALFSIATILGGCVQPAPDTRPWLLDPTADLPVEIPIQTTPTTSLLPAPRGEGAPYLTPTPDIPRILPTLRPDAEYYTIQYGDYLSAIALRYNIDLELLISANPAIDPNWLSIGQVIVIPALNPTVPSSSFKIIPDSELVYGPMSSTFDLRSFLNQRDGYLASYTEQVDDVILNGTQILERICYEYSVNPRLMLALLEYRSGWVTSRNISETARDYPMGLQDKNRKGLYKQLAWASNQLNRGYYLWKVNAISYVNLSNGNLVVLDPGINAGTAALQYMLGLQTRPDEWQKAVSETGIYKTYTNFFGIPFDLAVEPLIPADLAQPKFALPFEPSVAWSFTGGPHAGWGDGSAWAGLDFAPPGDSYGCVQSDSWVTAVADGVIIRSANGAVMQDLDGDGLEQTGWTVLYMHIESRDRIDKGSMVMKGGRIGHPSCEGGVSNGTHLHLARRFNGEWISADTNIPFILSGWVSAGDGDEYSGTLIKGDQIVYSWEGRVASNQIQR